jgi:hypothetical protein
MILDVVHNPNDSFFSVADNLEYSAAWNAAALLTQARPCILDSMHPFPFFFLLTSFLPALFPYFHPSPIRVVVVSPSTDQTPPS